MNIDTVRTQLAARLKTITGMRAYSYVPEKVEPPTAIISVGSGTYDETFADAMTVEFGVLLLVSRSDTRTQQTRLNDYITPTGTYSVKAAVEADVTLSGSASSAVVVGWSEPQTYEIANVGYLGVEFTVEVAD